MLRLLAFDNDFNMEKMLVSYECTRLAHLLGACTRCLLFFSRLFQRFNSGTLFFARKRLKDLSILQYDVIFLSPDFLGKLRGFSKSFAYVGSVAKGNIG